MAEKGDVAFELHMTLDGHLTSCLETIYLYLYVRPTLFKVHVHFQ